MSAFYGYTVGQCIADSSHYWVAIQFFVLAWTADSLPLFPHNFFSAAGMAQASRLPMGQGDLRWPGDRRRDARRQVGRTMTPQSPGWCLMDMVAFVFCVRGAGHGSGGHDLPDDEDDAVATQDPRPWIPEITQ
jgi:hypothetical protein